MFCGEFLLMDHKSLIQLLLLSSPPTEGLLYKEKIHWISIGNVNVFMVIRSLI